MFGITYKIKPSIMKKILIICTLTVIVTTNLFAQASGYRVTDTFHIA